MAVTLAGNGGPRNITGGRDAEGYRTYYVTHRVKCDVADSVANVINCPLLPQPGQFYAFMADIDVDAWCRFDMEVDPVRSRPDVGSPCRYYDVRQVFSNKPVPPDKQRCSETTPGDPLLEPQKVSGSFVRHTEEGTHDRFGNVIQTSSHEPIRGPLNEWDANRPTVRIEQNVIDLQLDLLAEFMRDGGMLNDRILWGVIPRGVRLSQVSWTRNYYGSCYKYYTRVLDFEVNVRKIPGTTGVSAIAGVALGSGYAVGDVLTVVGGSGPVPATILVIRVNAGGIISDFAVLNPGRYTSTPSNPVSTSGGTGTGAAFALTFAEVLVSGWDRDLLDEGTKVLHGEWDENGAWVVTPFDSGLMFMPDPDNPLDFQTFYDRKGNPSRVILNGRGLPIDTGNRTSGTDDDEAGNIHVEKYPQDDLTLLGIPLVL